MISFKWIILGLAVSVLSGVIFSQAITGIIFGTFTTLITDTFSIGKKIIEEKKW